MRYQTIMPWAVLALLAAGAASAGNSDFDASLLEIQQQWAVANYVTPAGPPREAAFAALAERAETFAEAHPDRAEAQIWAGIVDSTYAGVKGGLGALSLAKQARRRLEAALDIDADALQGSAHTSLGTLYHKVPGFPLGFGSDRKAREHLQRALQVNPAGIDPNYFYAEFLYDEGDYAQAMSYLQRADAAAPRPGREVADRGRRAEIAELAERVRTELSRS